MQEVKELCAFESRLQLNDETPDSLNVNDAEVWFVSDRGPTIVTAAAATAGQIAPIAKVTPSTAAPLATALSLT
jgi:hypothetical protein